MKKTPLLTSSPDGIAIAAKKYFYGMGIEAVARAIEEDAGEALPGSCASLADAKAERFARIHTPEQIIVRAARAKTGLSQQAFARRIRTPVATLRDWEQGRFPPSGAVLCLLKLIERRPELTRELETA